MPLNTPEEIADILVLDHDGEPVNTQTPNFVEMCALVDRLSFSDACLLLANYAYARAALEPDRIAQTIWRLSAEQLNLVAE